MKKLLMGVLLTMVLAGFASLARAEMAAGTYTVSFGGNLDLYDLSGTYSEDLGGINLNYTLTMEPSGKFTGVGTASAGDFFGYDLNLDMDLDFTGAVSVSGNVTRVNMQMKLKGGGTVEGYAVTFSANMKETCEIDTSSQSLVGTVSGKVNVAVPAMHKKASQPVRDTVNTPLPWGMNGSWDLVLNVIPSGKSKYTGSGEVALSNDRTLPFTVTGSYASKSDTSKLTLKGSGSNRGASVSVLGAFESGSVNVQTLAGKILGQTLKYKAN